MAGNASNRRLPEKYSNLQKNLQNVSNVNQEMYSNKRAEQWLINRYTLLKAQ